MFVSPPNPQGRRLSVVIANKLINVSALADELVIDQSNLSKILSGRKGARVSLYRKIAKALGITTDQLLDSIEHRANR